MIVESFYCRFLICAFFSAIIRCTKMHFRKKKFEWKSSCHDNWLLSGSWIWAFLNHQYNYLILDCLKFHVQLLQMIWTQFNRILDWILIRLISPFALQSHNFLSVITDSSYELCSTNCTCIRVTTHQLFYMHSINWSAHSFTCRHPFERRNLN